MLFKKSAELPTAETALPGRAEALATDGNHFVSGNPLQGPYPDGFQTAIFGMGCFWGVERIFWSLPGVWVTSAGYSGGITPIRPMKRPAPAVPAIPRWSRWCSTRRRSPMPNC